MSRSGTSAKPLSAACIAVNHLGYGGKPGELQLAASDPKQWCIDCLTTPIFSSELPGSKQVLADVTHYNQANKQAKKDGQPLDEKIASQARKTLRVLSEDTLRAAINSEQSIVFRLLDFFSNHFSVSAQGRVMAGLASTLEREAIAPNLLGNFADMLLAVSQHPAMLIYLNNENSFGENSRLGKNKGKGLNENLAREILELHTLGVDGGYSQQDVIELAKALTGWSVQKSLNAEENGFVFRAVGHEPGARTLLGQRYTQKGVQQAEHMLKDLAGHPKTAEFICKKLIHHFVGELAYPELLNTLTQSWLTSQGNLHTVMSALLSSDELWQLPARTKFKTPREFLISTVRLLSADNIYGRKNLTGILTDLGQQPFSAGSPAGFSDENQTWLSPTALMTRADWANLVAARFKRINTEALMQDAFAGSLSQSTYQSVLRAESREQGLALLLMSPEFQWR
ncbi:DUF1800 domain-containing protein [Alteromonas aestuariivivens]|nr:DUF1800 domain-containing protein [Alteromonas aestuariivivens]